MIDSSASAPPLLLQLVPQQQKKLTCIDVVVGTKEALKIYLQLSNQRDLQNEAQAAVFLGRVF